MELRDEIKLLQGELATSSAPESGTCMHASVHALKCIWSQMTAPNLQQASARQRQHQTRRQVQRCRNGRQIRSLKFSSKLNTRLPNVAEYGISVRMHKASNACDSCCAKGTRCTVVPVSAVHGSSHEMVHART